MEADFMMLMYEIGESSGFYEDSTFRRHKELLLYQVQEEGDNSRVDEVGKHGSIVVST